MGPGPSIPQGLFYGVDLSQATLYVPAGAAVKYRDAKVWKEFGKIVEMKK